MSVCVIWYCAVNVCTLHSHDFVCVYPCISIRRAEENVSVIPYCFKHLRNVSHWSKKSPSGLGWLFSKLQRTNCVCLLSSIFLIQARKAWLPGDLNSGPQSCTASVFTSWVISHAPKDLLKYRFWAGWLKEKARHLES